MIFFLFGSSLEVSVSVWEAILFLLQDSHFCFYAFFSRRCDTLVQVQDDVVAVESRVVWLCFFAEFAFCLEYEDHEVCGLIFVWERFVDALNLPTLSLCPLSYYIPTICSTFSPIQAAS